MYARLILLLARDYVADANLHAQIDPAIPDLATWSRLFSFLRFLETLVGPDRYDDVLRLGSGAVRTTRSSAAGKKLSIPLKEAFATAMLNFNHFSATDIPSTHQYSTWVMGRGNICRREVIEIQHCRCECDGSREYLSPRSD